MDTLIEIPTSPPTKKTNLNLKPTLLAFHSKVPEAFIPHSAKATLPAKNFTSFSKKSNSTNS